MRKNRVSTVLLVLLGILFLFPIYILFMTSFKSVQEIFAVSLWPKTPTLSSIKAAFNADFIRLQIASQNGHLCHIRRPLCDLNGGQPGTH